MSRPPPRSGIPSPVISQSKNPAGFHYPVSCTRSMTSVETCTRIWKSHVPGWHLYVRKGTKPPASYIFAGDSTSSLNRKPPTAGASSTFERLILQDPGTSGITRRMYRRLYVRDSPGVGRHIHPRLKLATGRFRDGGWGGQIHPSSNWSF